MKASVLVGVYWLLAVTVLLGTWPVQAMHKGSRSGERHPTTVPTTVRPTTLPATTIQHEQHTTQSQPTNTPQMTTTESTRNEPDPTTVPTNTTTLLQQTDSPQSSTASHRDHVTLVMGVVGGVVGLLLLIVIIVCSILLCTAASSYRKIKTASGHNKTEHSAEYGNKRRQDVENRGSNGEGHIYHVLEQATPGGGGGGGGQSAAVRHSYEIVDRESEDNSSNSSAGEVSLATTTTSCNSHPPQTIAQKTRDPTKHDYDEIIPSFNTPRTRLSNYDHLSEKESTKQWRYSLNEEGSHRPSFSPANKSEYDRLEKKGEDQAEKRKSEYSSLDETVHGYAVLKPHPSGSTPTTGTSNTQDRQYSHLIHR